MNKISIFILLCVYAVSTNGLTPLIIKEVTSDDVNEGAGNIRDSKKVVFFNNRAYDLSNRDQKEIWERYMERGQLPESDQPIEDAPVKSSRFVADPEKQHLIVEVDDTTTTTTKKPEVKLPSSHTKKQAPAIYTTSSPPKQEEAEEAVTTVYFEESDTSMGQFIVNELVYNLGSLFTRELYDDVSSVMSYLWNTVVYTIQGAARSFIQSRMGTR